MFKGIMIHPLLPFIRPLFTSIVHNKELFPPGQGLYFILFLFFSEFITSLYQGLTFQELKDCMNE